ncbi:MAG: tRNA epoxyqueuosine(34) reductase QueG, partial [Rhizobiaceae bacterium]
WNKFARTASEAKLAQRAELRAPPLNELLKLDDPAFRLFFSGSPVKRIGRDRFIRNVLIAAGNSGEAALAPRCEDLLEDLSPLVRGAAVWALSRLLSSQPFAVLAREHRPKETEPDVIAEWDAASRAGDSE